MKEISLAPTPEGYASMVRMMTSSIVGDIKRTRQQPSRVMLASIIEIAAYLGRTRPDLINALIKDTDRSREDI